MMQQQFLIRIDSSSDIFIKKLSFFGISFSKETYFLLSNKINEQRKCLTKYLRSINIETSSDYTASKT